MIRSALVICLRTLPKTRFFDWLFCTIHFFTVHRRFPSQGIKFNDYLFRTKVSPEILSPVRQITSDKYLSKIFAHGVLGRDISVPTLGVLRSAEDVDAFDFPDRCAIKPTHVSGKIILRKNGESIDREVIKSWLKLNHYTVSREANYRYLPGSIIVEPIIFDGADFNDIKLHCYKGKVRFIQFHYDLLSNNTIVFFNREFERQNFCINIPVFEGPAKLPDTIENMITDAEALAAAFDIVRIDLMSCGDTYFLGEVTNLSNSGHGIFHPLEAETEMSNYFFNTSS